MSYKIIKNKLIDYEKRLVKKGVLVIPPMVNGEVVEALGKSLFEKAIGIKKIIIPKTVKYIRENCFADSSIEEVIFDKGSQLEFIEPYAFSSTKLLKNIDFGDIDHYISFGEYCFANSHIKTIDLSQLKLKNIPFSMFENSKITTIKLPQTLEIIEDNSFRSCDQLVDINLNELMLLKKIGAEAFYQASLEGKFLSFDNNMEILHHAFAYCKIESIRIYSYKLKIGAYAFAYCPFLKRVTYTDSYFRTYDIEEGTFSNCSCLEEVKIGLGCKNIKGYAFSSCRIENLEFPKTITTIGGHSFENNNINKIDFSELKELKGIETFAFQNNLATENDIKFNQYMNGYIWSVTFSHKNLHFDYKKLIEKLPFIIDKGSPF